MKEDTRQKHVVNMEECWLRHDEEIRLSEVENKKRVEKEIQEYLNFVSDMETTDTKGTEGSVTIDANKILAAERRKADFRNKRKLKKNAENAKKNFRKRKLDDEKNGEFFQQYDKLHVSNTSRTAKANRLEKAANKRKLLAENG